jgi:hypothetical protein
VRLHAPVRRVADLDRDTGVGQLAQGLVGDRAHQDVDLHLVVRVDAQTAALDRVAHRLRARRIAGRQQRVAGRPVDEIRQDGGELAGRRRDVHLLGVRADRECGHDRREGASRRQSDGHPDYWDARKVTR